MRAAGFLVLGLWAIVVLPVWLLGMGFAGEFRLLPDYVSPAQFWFATAAMYLPPVVSVHLLAFSHRKPSVRSTHAAD